MSVRGIARRATAVGYAHGTNAPIYVDSDDNAVKIIPAGTGSTEVVVGMAASASGFRFAAGTGALVTGTLVVATGLTSVLAFSTSLSGTGAGATGATETVTIRVSSITTGAVSVVGSYQGATGTSIVSASGAETFYWIAIGT